MSFLHEKQSRNFSLFLLVLCLLLFLLLMGLNWIHAGAARDMLIEREQSLVSGLIKQGVEPGIIAASLKNTEVTERGAEFMRGAGRTDKTPFWLLSRVSQASFPVLIFSVASWIFFCLLLLSSALLFLKKRETLYQEAAATISQFAAGNFTGSLPRGQTGTLFSLFASADQLSKALMAKSESENKGKEFLKDTVSDISHQLKTPLAALSMYMEIISGEPDNKKTVADFSQKSIQSLARMEQLIQSMLKVMRLDAGSIRFEKENWPAAKLIARASDELSIRAKKEHKKLLMEGNPEETILCDLEWTGEALQNLIKNALDHTDTGDVIRVRWQRSPAMVRIMVEDNGCGILPEDIHHIFKRFYRSKHSHDRQGVGLGLPLAKAVVEGQGGLLSVQSTPGAGTVFTVSFLTEV